MVLVEKGVEKMGGNWRSGEDGWKRVELRSGKRG